MLTKAGTQLHEHWRLIVFLAIAAVVAALNFVVGGLVSGAGVVLLVASAVLLRQRSPSGPNPQLKLVPSDKIEFYPSQVAEAIFAKARGEEEAPAAPSVPVAQGPLVVGRRRKLDVNALLEDARTRAQRRAPGNSAFDLMLRGAMLNRYAPPTDSDREHFADDVEEYSEEMANWLAEVAEHVETRSKYLVADILLTNPGEVDADEARVVLHFPPGFSEATDLEMPERPQPPDFPLRASPLSRMLEPSILGPVRAPIIPLVASNSEQSLRRIERAVMDPEYSDSPRGLEISYPRRSIHHGETGSTGAALRVLCESEDVHNVRWEIHARNLPKAAIGSLSINYSSEEMGEPVCTLADLEHLLLELGLAESDD